MLHIKQKLVSIDFTCHGVVYSQMLVAKVFSFQAVQKKPPTKKHLYISISTRPMTAVGSVSSSSCEGMGSLGAL